MVNLDPDPDDVELIKRAKEIIRRIEDHEYEIDPNAGSIVTLPSGKPWSDDKVIDDQYAAAAALTKSFEQFRKPREKMTTDLRALFASDVLESFDEVNNRGMVKEGRGLITKYDKVVAENAELKKDNLDLIEKYARLEGQYLVVKEEYEKLLGWMQQQFPNRVNP